MNSFSDVFKPTMTKKQMGVLYFKLLDTVGDNPIKTKKLKEAFDKAFLSKEREETKRMIEGLDKGVATFT